MSIYFLCQCTELDFVLFIKIKFPLAFPWPSWAASVDQVVIYLVSRVLLVWALPQQLFPYEPRSLLMSVAFLWLFSLKFNNYVRTVNLPCNETISQFPLILIYLILPLQVLLRQNMYPMLVCFVLGTSYGGYCLPLLLSVGFLFTSAFMASWPQITLSSMQGMYLYIIIPTAASRNWGFIYTALIHYTRIHKSYVWFWNNVLISRLILPNSSISRFKKYEYIHIIMQFLSI